MTFRGKFADDFISDNRERLANNVSVAKCKWCGSLFVKEHNRELYCCDACRDNARLEQSRLKSSTWYHKHKHELSEKQRWGLGSGFLGSHRNLDFDEELECVRREFVRLRLKR